MVLVCMLCFMPTNKLYGVCQRTVATITHTITHTPGGYSYWTDLPDKGRHSRHVLMKNWATLVYTYLFPPTLHKAMLSASLSPDGTPTVQGKLLYTWLLINIYHNNEAALYKDWLAQ